MFDPDSQYTYRYDGQSRLKGIDNLGTPAVPTVAGQADFRNVYGYNSLSQLTRVTQSGIAGGYGVAEKRADFEYNAVGQLDLISRYANLAGTQLVATSDYTFDNAGRLTGLVHAKGPLQPSQICSRWVYSASVTVRHPYIGDEVGQRLGEIPRLPGQAGRRRRNDPACRRRSFSP